jgi:hypothetical protein
MSGLGRAGLIAVVGVILGCATAPIPPSEGTMSFLRSYRSQLEAKVASGHLTRAQARDLLYSKLGETQPPLPGLGDLVEFRKQVTAQVEARSLTPDQGEARLTARESEMLTRWEEMAARDAREQREMDRLESDYERGYRQQKQIEQQENIFRDRPRF